MKKILKIILALGIVVFGATSCSNWLDVNESPNVATEPNMRLMLTGVQWRMAVELGHTSNRIGIPLGVAVQHTTTREQNDHNFNPASVGFTNTWFTTYTELFQTLNALMREAEVNDALHFRGIARILKAFTFMTFVDIWGEVPFSQAFDLQTYTHPAPDRGQDIYNALFVMLRGAREDLYAGNSNPQFPIGAADLFYGGQIVNWVRLANSLQFRMLVNTRHVRGMINDWDGLLAEVIDRDDRIRGGTTAAASSNFQFAHTTAIGPPDERNPGFPHSYTAGHTQFPSAWIWEVMNGLTYNHVDNPLADIVDPRVPFYFFRQLAPDQTTNVTLPYRQGTFMAVFFGDNSPYRDASVANYATVWGIFPVGGRFDIGEGGDRGDLQYTANGAVPQRFYTFADMLFNEAEMTLVNLMPGGVSRTREIFSEAIDAAFDHLQLVVTGLPGVPTGVIPAAARNAYRDAVLARFDAATSDDDRMHLIMLQKWIHNVHNATEAFTSLRRTGFPVLFNPNVRGGFDPYTGEVRATSNTFNFPNTMPWPQNEVDRNRNMPQRDLVNPVRPFWMPETINL